jgi:hypothetical protein
MLLSLVFQLGIVDAVAIATVDTGFGLADVSSNEWYVM